FLQSNWISVINESQALQVNDLEQLEITRLTLPA
ncbi:transcriptional regulator, partial [Pseudomonas sp. MAFF 311095]|nr:transcriptional regulator [Pseudomonas petroselini]